MSIMLALWRIMNKKFIPILIVIILLLAGAGVYYSGILNKPATEPVTPVVEEPVVLDEEIVKLVNVWKENKAINDDYIGEVLFDSGLIHESFVQAKDVYDKNGDFYTFYTQNGSLVTEPGGYTGNDVYIWTYWKTGEYDYNNHGGSVWLDYRNELDDQNLIIYGHHFSVWNDETRTKAFTPLEKLLEAENYNDNKTVTLVLENEVRKYLLACVYEFDATQDRFYEDFQFWRTNYNYDPELDTVDKEYYQKYLNNIRSEQLYFTGVDLTTDDKTLTLQTCISGHTGELFEICVFKEVEVISLEGYK